MKFNLTNIKNKKILTVTLNPAIDKQWHIYELQVGEVNRIKEVNDSAGGKGLNETRILHQLKLDVTATGIIAGQNGDHLIDALNREGIKHNFYKLSYDQTRICVNANDYKNHKITELLEPGPTIKEQDTLTFLAFFKKLVKGFDIVSLAGSLPNGLKPNFYGKLISICRAQKIKVFLDTSNQALIQNLSSKPDFIKPNIDEIRQIMKVKDFNQAKAITFAKRWNMKGITNFVISLGSSGAILIANKKVFHATPPKLPIMNTVGCGDTLVAGFIVAELLKLSLSQKIYFAVGLASNAATTKATACLNLKTLDKAWPTVKEITRDK